MPCSIIIILHAVQRNRPGFAKNHHKNGRFRTSFAPTCISGSFRNDLDRHLLLKSTYNNSSHKCNHLNKSNEHFLVSNVSILKEVIMNSVARGASLELAVGARRVAAAPPPRRRRRVPDTWLLVDTIPMVSFLYNYIIRRGWRVVTDVLFFSSN